jgi:hypothetical protein
MERPQIEAAMAEAMRSTHQINEAQIQAALAKARVALAKVPNEAQIKAQVDRAMARARDQLAAARVKMRDHAVVDDESDVDSDGPDADDAPPAPPAPPAPEDLPAPPAPPPAPALDAPPPPAPPARPQAYVMPEPSPNVQLIKTADLKPITVQLKMDDGKIQTLRVKTIRLDKLSVADRETLRNLVVKVQATPQGKTVHVQAAPITPAPQN